MIRRALGAAVLGLLPTSILADDVQAFAEHLGKAVGAFEAVAIYHQDCDARHAEGVVARKDAVAAWAYDNERADFERILAGLLAQLPDLSEQIDPQTEAIRTDIAADLDRAPEQCGDFETLLENEQFDVRSDVRRLMSLSRSLGFDIPVAPEIVPAVKSPDTVEIVRLATLSARLKLVMAEIASEAGARSSSTLRRARGEHAEAWLEADGMQVVFGRVTDDDEMREWRGDVQSTFKLECRSFSEDAHEERMAASIGQEMVVVGAPRLVIDGGQEGRISLDRCSLFTLDEVGRPFVEEEDSAGLMLRPLEFDEAYAGPDQGIAPGDVDRVLYASSFDFRIDGFGNSYTDRDESIFVLLRDGSAYRHDWSFPFTDLAVDRSREREPSRWYRWSEEREGVVLTGVGDYAEERVALHDAQRLQPFTAPSLDADYYYLQIGMGGRRSDRRYAFSADGSVRYSRGGFVAGNVGTSYIIVSGADDPAVQARYSFEDYALILETDEGEERHFFAVPESADGVLPDTLLIDGIAYWLDDDSVGQ